MAAVTHQIGTASSVDGTSYASGAFTPAAGQLLVVFVGAPGTTDGGTLSGSTGLTFYRAGTITANTKIVSVFVSEALTTAVSQTVTFSCAGGAATGAIIEVASVSGMSRTGASAALQVITNSGGIGAPSLTFAAACNTNNPTLVMVSNANNAATITPPAGWTERSDIGFATPTTGAEYATRDSGFAGTLVTFGSSASAWTGIGIELDASVVAPTTGVTTTSAVNTIAIESDTPLSGFNLVGAIGSMLLGVTLALSGVSGLGDVGTTSLVDTVVGLSGVSGTGVVDNTLADTSPVVSGVTDTGSVGSAIAEISSTLSGVIGTGSAYNADPTTELAGVVGTGFAGSITYQSNDVILSLSGTGDVGSAGGFTADAAATLFGATDIGAAGNVLSVSDTTLSGASGTGSADSVVAGVDTTLTGTAGTTAVGSTQFLGTDLTLSGVSATGDAGFVIAVSPDIAVQLTGANGVGDIGSAQSLDTVVGLFGANAVGVVDSVQSSTDLTGVIGTGSVNAPVIDIDMALAGISGVGSAGTIQSASVDLVLSGASGLGSIDTAPADNITALSGTLGVGAVDSGQATDVGVVLVGVSGTGSIYSAEPISEMAGVVGTGDVGTITFLLNDITLALTSTSAAGSAGDIIYQSFDVITALVGVTAPGAIDSMSFSVVADLSGTATAGYVGGLTPSSLINAVGRQVLGTIGNVTQGLQYPLTGNDTTTAVGNIIGVLQHITLPITGVSGSGAVDGFSFTESGSVDPTGIEAAGTIGTLACAIANAIAGNESPSAVGGFSFTKTGNVALTRVSALGSVGSLTYQRTKAFTGVVGGGNVGSLGVVIGNPSKRFRDVWQAVYVARQVLLNKIDDATRVAGVANATATTALTTRVTANENSITSQASSITALSASIAVKTTTFVQPTAPSGTGRTVGDTWIDSDDANKLYTWDGALWALRNLDAGVSVFAQIAAPSGVGRRIGDLWYDTDDNNKLYRWDGSAWVEISDARIAANATALSSLTTRVTVAEGTITSQSSSITSLNSSVVAAQTSANNAASAAAAAQTSANTANSTLSDIASDSLLTPGEKPVVITNRDVIVNEQSGIDAQATAYGITTEKASYDSAVNALVSYLATLTSPVAWDNLSGNTTIVGTTFRTNFSDVFATRQALLNKLTAVTKTNLDSNASATSALTTRVTATEGSITSQSSSITSLSNRVTTTETNITNQVDATTALTTRITDMQGAGQNMLTNSAVQANVLGWVGEGSVGGTFGRDTLGSAYMPAGMHTLVLSPASTGTVDVDYYYARQDVVCEPGKAYIASAYLCAERAKCFVYLIWLNQAGGTISTSITTSDAVAGGGTDLASNYTRMYLKATAPAGAKKVGVCFAYRKSISGVGGNNPYVLILRPMLEEVAAAQTTPSRWNSGGAEMFASYSLTLNVNGYVSGYQSNNDGTTANFAILADNFSIQSPGGGARTEYSLGNWRVYDASNVLRVRMGVW